MHTSHNSGNVWFVCRSCDVCYANYSQYTVHYQHVIAITIPQPHHSGGSLTEPSVIRPCINTVLTSHFPLFVTCRQRTVLLQLSTELDTLSIRGLHCLRLSLTPRRQFSLLQVSLSFRFSLFYVMSQGSLQNFLGFFVILITLSRSP